MVRRKIGKHKRSLHAQILDPEMNGVRTKPHAKKRQKTDSEDSDTEMGSYPVSADLSHAILREARAQQEEMEETGNEGHEEREEGPSALLSKAVKAAMETLNEEDELEVSEGEELLEEVDFDDTRSYMTVEPDGLTEEDKRIFDLFLPPNSESYRQNTLGDLVLAKIREKQQQMGLNVMGKEGEEALPEGIDTEVAELYQKVGLYLSRYRSGKLPKAFHFIPLLKNWEEVLFLTNPEAWTPHAYFVATRNFVANLNEKMAQRFLNLVLLPKVRQDIRENKRLHKMLFEALKRACYKPGAFYKGVLLPLCQSGTCTVREAVIFSSVMKKVSLSVLHSSAALLRMADMDYSGTTSFFINVLLSKKYALPYKVIDALVLHFTRFEHEERQLPVVWHQSLLVFIQLYKNDIKDEGKVAIKRLLKVQKHHLMTAEIHKEMESAVRSRNKKVDVAEKSLVGKNEEAVGDKMADLMVLEEY